MSYSIEYIPIYLYKCSWRIISNTLAGDRGKGRGDGGAPVVTNSALYFSVEDRGRRRLGDGGLGVILSFLLPLSFDTFYPALFTFGGRSLVRPTAKRASE